MKPERWRQIEELYNSALLLEAAARTDFLVRACAGDAELYEELASLLSSAESLDSFLEEPALSLGLELLRRESGSLAGQQVGRYKLLQLLGCGGMGEVYLAHDPRLNRRVALKVLPHSITGDHERVRRFIQEARAASAISHPNVAHIYEIDETQGRRYITMEYVAGQTLRQTLRHGPLPLHQALDIAIGVATALVAAHATGVVHRDIKPENIMLGADGYLKVLDFGLAKHVRNVSEAGAGELEVCSSLHTEPALWMGTSEYMSPEQVRRLPVDGRTDQWSLGVVLYEMLTKRRPFRGTGFSEILIAVLEQEPEPLNHLLPELPATVQALVTKTLQKDPAARYQTTEVLLAELQRLRRELEFDRASVLDTAPAAGVITDANARPRPPLLANRHAAGPPAADEPAAGSFEPYIPPWPVAASIPVPAAPFLSPRRLLAGSVLLLLLMMSAGSYLVTMRARAGRLQDSALQPRFERLYLSGSINDLVISPDGKYVARILTEAGRQTVRVTELATSSDLSVVPPSDKGYSGLAFTPDGNYIYYLENQTETGTLYRVSKFGGGQRKILSNVNTPVTFAPDGQRLAFIRFDIPNDTPDLIIAQADGTAERVLTKRTDADADVFPADMNGVGPVWSPDEQTLACPTVNRARSPQEMNLEIFDVTRGTSRRLNAKPWYDISRVAWLADGSGLVVAAAASPAAPRQLFLLGYPGGAVRPLTNDPNNYSRVSLTADSSTFLTLNVEENASIWRLSAAHDGQHAPLVVSQQQGVTEVAWGSGGELIYTVSAGDRSNLWARTADGTTNRQLTFEPNNNYRPTITPDRRYIVFVSARTGKDCLWRMDADGTHLKQLTFDYYADMPSVTPDGRWVIYRTGSSIRKVPLDGGSSVTLLDQSALYPVVSPDGRLLACLTNPRPDERQWELAVFDLRTLAPVQRFALPDTTVPFNGLRWTPDGRGLAYVSNADGASNLWLQPLQGGAPQQLTNFKDAEILSFAWSADGREIACARNVKTYTPVLLRPF